MEYDPNFYQESHNYVPQVNTWQYSTYIKRWAVEAMQDAFAAHTSTRIQGTKVAVEFNQDDYKLPAVLVKWQEHSNSSIGVGHEEWLPSPYDPDPANPTIFIKYYHRLYYGSLNFEVYGQSSVDTAMVRDVVAEILMTTDATPWGNQFVQRLYFYMNSTPYGYWNFPTLNTDRVRPSPEMYRPLPWNPEDKLCYSAGYTIEVMGDLYSATPDASSNYGGFSLVEEVDLTVTQVSNINDPTSVLSTDFYTFTGWPSGATEV